MEDLSPSSASQTRRRQDAKAKECKLLNELLARKTTPTSAATRFTFSMNQEMLILIGVSGLRFSGLR